MPFSLRELPSCAEDHILNNNFTIITLKLNLCDTFGEAIAFASSKMNAMKRSVMPHGVMALSALTAWFPPVLS